jgi:hypothetical protein
LTRQAAARTSSVSFSRLTKPGTAMTSPNPNRSISAVTAGRVGPSPKIVAVRSGIFFLANAMAAGRTSTRLSGI